jgi:uncharacterized membrane protein
MKLSWMLVFNAVVAVAFAIPAILVPGALYSLYGISGTSGGAQLVMQLFGSTLIAEAVITWQLRDVAPGPTRNTVTLALFAEAVIGLLVSLLAQLGGVMNALGWGVVALPVIFALGYGYYRFVRPDAA